MSDSPTTKAKVRLALNNTTKPTALDPGLSEVAMWEGKPGEEKLWLKGPILDVPQSLCVLYRDHSEMTWLKPKIHMLPDDAESFPAGKIRFVNTSDKVILIKLGKERPFAIKPGKFAYRALNEGENKLQVAYRSPKDEFRHLYMNALKADKNERVQWFFYKAQDEKRGSSVKYHHFTETPLQAAKAGE